MVKPKRYAPGRGAFFLPASRARLLRISFVTFRARRGTGGMSLVIALLLWALVFALSWPLAIVLLIALPFLWLLSIPFRIVAYMLEGVFGLLKGLLCLPARFLRGR